MATEIVKSETRDESVESEQGLMLMVLVMVVLGVAGVYLVSA